MMKRRRKRTMTCRTRYTNMNVPPYQTHDANANYYTQLNDIMKDSISLQNQNVLRSGRSVGAYRNSTIMQEFAVRPHTTLRVAYASTNLLVCRAMMRLTRTTKSRKMTVTVTLKTMPMRTMMSTKTPPR